MNILIVGNGFDLSHYLPTKYDHFMVAMQAIQKWNILKGDMCFDDLFASRYETENWFFKYTKAIYRTEDIKINLLDLQDLKKNSKKMSGINTFYTILQRLIHGLILKMSFLRH